MPQMPFFSSSLCTGNEIRQSVRNILESAMRTAAISLLSKKGKYIFYENMANFGHFGLELHARSGRADWHLVGRKYCSTSCTIKYWTVYWDCQHFCTKAFQTRVSGKQYIPSLLVMVIILKKPGCRQEGKRFLFRFPFFIRWEILFSDDVYVGEKRSGGLLKKIMGQDHSKSSISYLGSFPGRGEKVEYALPDIKAEKLGQKKWAAQKKSRAQISTLLNWKPVKIFSEMVGGK